MFSELRAAFYGSALYANFVCAKTRSQEGEEGVKDFAYSRIIFALPESTMKRANAHYDLAKWDIKFPVAARNKGLPVLNSDIMLHVTRYYVIAFAS